MRGIANYRRTDVESAPREELVVLLFAAAVRREETADAAMARGDRSAWNAELHVARAIFLELLQALDPATPSAVADPLRTTYRWLVHHLTVAGRDGDRARLAEVRRVTAGLHDTWARALAIHRGEAPAEEGA
ncbi:MAG: flagellar export chaperone FliS [Myxococcota bacterium]